MEIRTIGHHLLRARLPQLVVGCTGVALLTVRDGYPADWRSIVGGALIGFCLTFRWPAESRP